MKKRQKKDYVMDRNKSIFLKESVTFTIARVPVPPTGIPPPLLLVPILHQRIYLLLLSSAERLSALLEKHNCSDTSMCCIRRRPGSRFCSIECDGAALSITSMTSLSLIRTPSWLTKQILAQD